METSKELHSAFKHNYYLFRRKVLKVFGGAFHAYDENAGRNSWILYVSTLKNDGK